MPLLDVTNALNYGLLDKENEINKLEAIVNVYANYCSEVSKFIRSTLIPILQKQVGIDNLLADPASFSAFYADYTGIHYPDVAQEIMASWGSNFDPRIPLSQQIPPNNQNQSNQEFSQVPPAPPAPPTPPTQYPQIPLNNNAQYPGESNDPRSVLMKAQALSPYERGLYFYKNYKPKSQNNGSVYGRTMIPQV